MAYEAMRKLECAQQREKEITRSIEEVVAEIAMLKPKVSGITGFERSVKGGLDEEPLPDAKTVSFQSYYDAYKRKLDTQQLVFALACLLRERKGGDLGESESAILMSLGFSAAAINVIKESKRISFYANQTQNRYQVSLGKWVISVESAAVTIDPAIPVMPSKEILASRAEDHANGERLRAAEASLVRLQQELGCVVEEAQCLREQLREVTPVGGMGRTNTSASLVCMTALAALDPSDTVASDAGDDDYSRGSDWD